METKTPTKITSPQSSTINNNNSNKNNSDKDWEQSEEFQNIINKFQSIIDSYNEANCNIVEINGRFKIELYNLVTKYTNGNSSTQKLIDIFKYNNILISIKNFDTVLSDIFWLISTEIETLESKDNIQKPLLISLIKECVSQNVVPSNLLKERLDLDLLESTGIINSQKKFLNKIVRINTRDVYTQVKFNLFKEETEGFSKILSELNKGQLLNENTVDSTIQNIKSLIGYFNLDPNRVLDIVLDSFEQNFGNAECFLKILKNFKVSAIPQLLGFKYQFYQQQQLSQIQQIKQQLEQQAAAAVAAVSADKNDSTSTKSSSTASESTPILQPSTNPNDIITPKSLYMVTAFLLKEKLFTLESIYPHLAPSDEEIKTQYQNRREEIIATSKTRGQIVLTSTEDSNSNTTSKKEQAASQAVAAAAAAASELVQENQKFNLLVALLENHEVECTGQLLYNLSSSQIDVASNTQVSQALISRLSQIIDPLYKPISFNSLRDACVPTSTNISVNIDLQAFIDSSEMIFFLLGHLGVFLSQDIKLFLKICRILEKVIIKLIPLSNEQQQQQQQQQNNSNNGNNKTNNYIQLKSDIESILSSVILPTFSMIPENPCIANEIWDILKHLPYDKRYQLYFEWKSQYNKILSLICLKAEVTSETKKIMRRLSKDNFKQFGKSIGKLGHAHPVIILEVILTSVETYDSLVTPLVDALRYISTLSSDVLSFGLLERLCIKRDKLKADGTNIASWFQALSLFIGSFYKKYPLTELEGILQYTVNQLKDNNSLDLIILKELLLKMGSTEIVEEPPEAQMEAQAGGENLKQETTTVQIQGVRNTKKPINKLKEALISSKLAFPLFILIAKQRFNIIHDSNEHQHIKLISDLYDKCQETLLQYTEFLSSHSTPEKYSEFFKEDFGSLINIYSLEPESAFHIYRPIFNQMFNNKLLNSSTSSSSNSPTTSTSSTTTSTTTNEPTSKLITSTIKPIYNDDIWKAISPELYSTFWAHSLYDIYVPKTLYESEITKLKKQISELEYQYVQSGSKDNKKKKEKERIQSSLDKLQREFNTQNQNHQKVLESIQSQKDKFFQEKDATIKKESLIKFLQYCIFPRATFTPADAIYCSKFVQILHTINTPNFGLMNYYNELISMITFTVFSSTENEANRFGRFLSESFGILSKWKLSESIYEKECGKIIKFNYENFVKFFTKCHKSICDSFTLCLNSGEYMVIRNGLLVLTKLVSYFPAHKSNYESIDSLVSQLRQREDLKTLASRYNQILEKEKQRMIDDIKPKKLNNINSPPSTSPSSSSKQDKESSKQDKDIAMKEKDKDVSMKEIKEDKSSSRDNEREKDIKSTSSRDNDREKRESDRDIKSSRDIERESKQQKDDRDTKSSRENDRDMKQSRDTDRDMKQSRDIDRDMKQSRDTDRDMKQSRDIDREKELREKELREKEVREKDREQREKESSQQREKERERDREIREKEKERDQQSKERDRNEKDSAQPRDNYTRNDRDQTKEKDVPRLERDRNDRDSSQPPRDSYRDRDSSQQRDNYTRNSDRDNYNRSNDRDGGRNENRDSSRSESRDSGRDGSRNNESRDVRNNDRDSGRNDKDYNRNIERDSGRNERDNNRNADREYVSNRNEGNRDKSEKTPQPSPPQKSTRSEAVSPTLSSPTLNSPTIPNQTDEEKFKRDKKEREKKFELKKSASNSNISESQQTSPTTSTSTSTSTSTTTSTSTSTSNKDRQSQQSPPHPQQTSNDNEKDERRDSKNKLQQLQELREKAAQSKKDNINSQQQQNDRVNERSSNDRNNNERNNNEKGNNDRNNNSNNNDRINNDRNDRGNNDRTNSDRNNDRINNDRINNSDRSNYNERGNNDNRPSHKELKRERSEKEPEEDHKRKKTINRNKQQSNAPQQSYHHYGQHHQQGGQHHGGGGGGGGGYRNEKDNRSNYGRYR